MSRRRTRNQQLAEEQFKAQAADEHVASVIPDEEIDAEAQEAIEAERDEIDAAASEGETADLQDELAAESEAALFDMPGIDVPPFDPEIFERGPLAAGIRMCEALLTQAKAGYINEQIDELARVLDVDFTDPERFFLGNVAAQERTTSGLPDVAGAYRALVRAKAQVQS